MILFTTDNENGYISTSANFKQFESIEEMKKSVCQNPKNLNHGDFYISDVQTDDFGDCWIKFYKKPDLFTLRDLDDEAGKVKICKPGSHPGGNEYWTTPIADVYVPVWTEKIVWSEIDDINDYIDNSDLELVTAELNNKDLSAECPHCQQLDGYVSTGQHSIT